MGNKSERISPERQALIVSLYQDGHSRLKVARDAGTTIETVTKVLRKHGIGEFRPHFSHVLSQSDVQAIAARYQFAGESIGDLAREYDVSFGTVSKWLSRHGVPRRDERGRNRLFTVAEYERMKEMTAAGCSQNEIASALSSSRDTIQKVMAREGIAPARRGAARGAQHGKWRGGRWVRADGYVELSLSTDSPFRVMAKRASTVLEHRIVMATALGRPLADSESVHHINGDRQDNRLENLQLRQGQHGSGAAFKCLDCGSTNVAAVKLVS